MSTVPIIYYYDGQLLINEDDRPKYVGGRRKGSKIKNYCSFEELKRCVFEVTKINPSEFDIQLVAKWVRDDGSSAIEVGDDEDTDSMFSVGMKVIEIYVNKSKRVHVEEPEVSMVESLPITHFQETHCSAPSYMSSHGVGEFTNLMNTYSSFVGVPCSLSENLENNFVHPNYIIPNQPQTTAK